MNPHTYEAALYAAGAGAAAVDAVMGGEARTAFVRCVRPGTMPAAPGHGLLLPEQRGHRGPPRAGLPRPVAGGHRDFDVHHGNGTEDVFAGDERVLMCSFFQHPFFPNSGA